MLGLLLLYYLGAGLHTPAEVIQKVAAATPENLEALEKELEECLKEHLEACRGDRTTTPPHSSVTLAASGSVLQDTGSQKDHMKSESDKCLDQAKKAHRDAERGMGKAWQSAHKTTPHLYRLYLYTNFPYMPTVGTVGIRPEGEAKGTGEEGGRREEAAGDGAARQGAGALPYHVVHMLHMWMETCPRSSS